MKKRGVGFGAIGLIALALVTSLGLAGAVEGAPGTGTETTVDIVAGPASAVVAFSGMAPGDSVARPIKVSNNGSTDLRYSVRSTTTEAMLAAQLDLTVRGSATSLAGCDSAHFESSQTTALYLKGALGSPGGTDIIGDPALGLDTGDRTLAAGAEEYLCFQVELPLSTGNAYQGLDTTATFHFIAE